MKPLQKTKKTNHKWGYECRAFHSVILAPHWVCLMTVIAGLLLFVCVRLPPAGRRRSDPASCLPPLPRLRRPRGCPALGSSSACWRPNARPKHPAKPASRQWRGGESSYFMQNEKKNQKTHPKWNPTLARNTTGFETGLEYENIFLKLYFKLLTLFWKPKPFIENLHTHAWNLNLGLNPKCALKP